VAGGQEATGLCSLGGSETAAHVEQSSRRGELYGVPEDAVRLRFREFTSKPDAPTNTAFPGKVFAVSNIPIRAH